MTQPVAPAMPVPLPQRDAGLLALHERDPGVPACSIGLRLAARQAFDPTAVEAAAAALATRHPMLRSRVTRHGGRWERAVLDAARPDVRQPGARDPVPTHELERLVEDLLGRPFDLAVEGPLRVAVLPATRVEPHGGVLVAAHHSAVDYDALLLLAAELGDLVFAPGTHRGDPTSPEALAALADREDATALRWWLDQLADLPAGGVPGRRDGTPARGLAGRLRREQLPPDLAEAIVRVPPSLGSTPFACLLATLRMAAYRFTGERRGVVGVPTSLRGDLVPEDLVCNAVTLLPLALTVDTARSLRTAARETGVAVMEAMGRRHVPFEVVASGVRAREGGTAPALVQVTLDYHDGAATRAGRDHLRWWDARLVPTRTAKHGLGVSLERGPEGGVSLHVEWNADAFDGEAVAAFCDDWLAVLAAALRHPDERLDGLHRPRTWVVGSVPERPAQAGSLAAAFARAAGAHPGEVAVDGGGARLTYRELHDRASDAARRLAEVAGPGDTVMVRGEPAAATVVAMLATALVGATYVPVDVELPQARQDLLTELSGATAVVDATGGDLAIRTAAGAGDRPAVPVPDAGLGVPALLPAYVIFTSGTTGRPKGVEVPHHNVVTLVREGQELFGYGPGDRWPWLHSFGFDFSVWELWAPLLTGGTVLPVPRGTVRDPFALLPHLVSAGATVLNQTPAGFASLAFALQERPGAFVPRWTFFGGDKLGPDVARTAITALGRHGTRLVNMFGITEATVHSTFRDVGEDGGRYPAEPGDIGRDLPHTVLAVTSDTGAVVPPGALGEIVVAGDGVALGYRGRPRETAERFVPDRLTGRPGARAYRSGDLGRRLGSGELAYHGRRDRQVKVRGHRIELDEVQELLRRVPGVTDAVAVLSTDRDGNAEIVAGIAVEDPQAHTPASLRESAASSLPGYMVPARLVVLRTLPTTPNGKVDTAAVLAAAPRAGRAAAPSTDPPPGAVPAMTEGSAVDLVARAFAAALGTAEFGPGDEFFLAGGDSISVVHAVSRLREAGLEVDVADVYLQQTPAELGPLLAGRGPASGDTGAGVDGAPPAPGGGHAAALLGGRGGRRLPDGADDAYPMTSLQQVMVFHQAVDRDALPYHNVNAFEIAGPWDQEGFEAALQRASADHPVLRTSFDIGTFDVPTQVVHASADLPCTRTDLRGLGPEDQRLAVHEACLEERRTPFDVERPGLLRVRVLQLADDRVVALVADHHAILDGWSFTTLLARLLRQDAATEVRPRANHFKEYVEAEQRALRSEAARAFWTGYAQGLPPAETAWGQGNAAQLLEVPLRADDQQRMSALRDRAGVSAKAAAQALHFRALGALLDADEVVSGLSVNGRSGDAGSVEALGLFLNTLPLRLAQVRERPVEELAGELFAQERAMAPYRTFPLSEILALGHVSALGSNFGRVQFRSLAQPSGDLRIAPVSLLPGEPLWRQEPSSFDLNVVLVDDPAGEASMLSVDYNAHVFDKNDIGRYLQAFGLEV